MSQVKRSREDFENDSTALPGTGREGISGGDEQLTDDTSAHKHHDDWQVAESRSSKRRKKQPRKDGDKYPTITHSSHARLQSVVKIADLQNLVLYFFADGSGPQWCSIKNHANVKKIVVLMVPGLEMDMFSQDYPMPTTTNPLPQDDNGSDEATDGDKHENGATAGFKRKAFSSPDDFYPKQLKQPLLSTALQPLADIFDHVWPIKTPGDDKHAKMHSPLAAMLTTSLVKDKKDKTNEKGPSAPAEAKRWRDHRTRITEYVASTGELASEGYVLHPAHFADNAAEAASYLETRKANKTGTDDGWVDVPDIVSLTDGDVPESQIEKGAVTAGRSILAIDCEMCITSPADVQPPVYSLTRMSVIDWDGNVVLDELVKPADPITNYLTPYSGITEKMLEDVTTTLQDAQQKLLAKITPHTILIGHSLDSDLNALRLTHPFIIDTALLYPHPRGPPLKSSLKWLSQKYLGREIQAGHGSTGHNSVEDGKASLDLVKQKCEKGKLWGTNDASNESIFQRLSRATRPKRQKLHLDGEAEPRLGAVVDWGEPKRGFGAHANVTVGCKDDTEVVAGIKRAVNPDNADNSIPAGGVDFTWARLRELEAYREWWRASKTADGNALREAALARNASMLLGDVVAQTVERIVQVHKALPPCTALIVYSGSSDPRKLSELSETKQRYKAEYAVKKWDELSVKWTDAEEQEMRRACEVARRGIGFITVK